MPFTSLPARSRRDLWSAVVGRAVSFAGDEAAVIALTLLLAPHGPWAVAGLMVAGFAPMVVMAPLAGLLVDRHDSRHLLVGTAVAQTVVCAALALTTSLPAIFALVLLLGAGQAITAATWSALLPGIVGRANTARAVGVSQAASNAAMIVAPALAGVLVGVGGARLVLVLDVATYVVLALAAGTVGHRRRIGATGAGTDDWRAGARVLRADRTLELLVGMLFLFVLLGGMLNIVSVFLIRYTLHAGPAWYGAEATVFGAAMLGGSLAAARLSGERALLRCAVVSMVMLTGSLGGYAVVPQVVWLLPFAVVGGIGNALLNVSVNTVIALRVGEEVRGRVSAAINGLMASAMAASMLVGGLVASVLTPREVFAVTGMIGLVIPLVVGPKLLAVREDSRVTIGSPA